MAHPMRKHSRARRDKRRSQWKLTLAGTTQCLQCGKRILPHRVCASCGYYRGKQVIVVAKKKKKEARAK